MGLSPSDAARLDNPAWYALQGRHAAHAQPDSDGKAMRYEPEVAFFSAVDELGEDGWSALAGLIGEGGAAVLFRDEVPTPPEGWTELYRGVGYQLVAEALDPAPPLETTPLGSEDVDEMLALTQLTEPGPFFARTIELGGYVGVREAGRLIAMAGRRFSLPGWTEVSAVCTHPDGRRRGMGAALTLQVAHGIRALGDEAFLHVLTDNESALRLYRSIGFAVRRKVDVVAIQFGTVQSE